MENRELGLVEIYERIKAKRTDLDLAAFRRTPTSPIKKEHMSCLVMLEGLDQIIKTSGRSMSGYPAQRVVEVTLEMITTKDTDIKALYRSLRSVVFTDRVTGKYNPKVATNLFFSENRTEGPTGYGLPDVLGMRLILDLVYTDNGL